MAFDPSLAERIRKVMNDRTDLVEKPMFGGLCFMIRGHMCCGIIDSTLMVRLAPDDADTLIEEPHVRPMDFTGRPMRGYLFVDAEGLATASSLRTWVTRCVRFVETMPIKAASKQRPRRATTGGTRTRRTGRS